MVNLRHLRGWIYGWYLRCLTSHIQLSSSQQRPDITRALSINHEAQGGTLMSSHVLGSRGMWKSMCSFSVFENQYKKPRNILESKTSNIFKALWMWYLKNAINEHSHILSGKSYISGRGQKLNSKFTVNIYISIYIWFVILWLNFYFWTFGVVGSTCLETESYSAA